MINKETGIFVFYKDELGINVIHYHSFEKFREIIPKEWNNKDKNTREKENKCKQNPANIFGIPLANTGEEK